MKKWTIESAMVELCTPSYALGLLYIILVVLIWTAASFMTQFVYEDLDFNSPFVFTYLSSTFFALYLAMWKFEGHIDKGQKKPSWSDQSREGGGARIKVSTLAKQDVPSINVMHEVLLESEEESITYSQTSDSCRQSLEPRREYATSSETENSIVLTGGHLLTCMPFLKTFIDYIFEPLTPDYTHMDLIYLATLLCPLCFIGNYFYNLSLAFTSIGSSTIISNLSGAFTLFFSSICGVEDVTSNKVLGVMFCLGGVVLVSISDRENAGNSDSDTNSLFGDVMGIIGALGYGLYTTLIKLKVPEVEMVSIQLLFGWVGVVNAILFLPAIIVLVVYKLDNIYQLTGRVFGFILVEEIFDAVIANFLYTKAVILTSPTIVTVGVSLTIPLAIVTDVLKGNVGYITTSTVVGAVGVTMGFIIITLDPQFMRFDIVGIWRTVLNKLCCN